MSPTICSATTPSFSRRLWLGHGTRLTSGRACCWLLAATLSAVSAFSLAGEACASSAAAAAAAPPPPPPLSSTQQGDDQQGTARAPAPSFLVTGVRLHGLQRTQADWLEGYIGQVWPSRLSQADVDLMVRKILTTAVFSSVSARLVEDRLEGGGGAAKSYLLHVDVVEKWTTIPVVRAALGGGTPLGILGIYDIHTAGRLVTFGGEAQKYGDAPIGFVLYARAPRLDGGRWFLAGDVWREFRRRTIYAPRTDKILGEIATGTTMVRLSALGPVGSRGFDFASRHRAGVDLAMLQEEPVGYRPQGGQEPSQPENLQLPAQVTTAAKLLPTYLYDAVAIDNILYDGGRLLARAGPLFLAGSSLRHALAELEGYHFKLWPYGLNSAVRGVANATSHHSPRSQYFLGGLDTVRGIADGALYGTKALYVNAELRHLSYRARHLWVQSLVFSDVGAAANGWSELAATTRASAGFGVRLAVPQITRLMFRVDYAWAIDGTSAQGLTAGLNQFFDPYRPL